jgi:putative membrane protein
MTLRDIPALNASLNGLATVLITAGFILIKTGRKEAHRKVMTAAMVVSAVFLVGYVTHKILICGVHTPFGGEGLIRPVYYTMLITLSWRSASPTWCRGPSSSPCKAILPGTRPGRSGRFPSGTMSR